MNWEKGKDMGFKVGDTVYFHGMEGQVIAIEERPKYPVQVSFVNRVYNFCMDGRIDEHDEHPALTFKPQPMPDMSRPAWEPKPGEWCWFWDDIFEKNSSVLTRFECMVEGLFKTTRVSSYEYCAPFTGELPPHLKEEEK